MTVKEKTAPANIVKIEAMFETMKPHVEWLCARWREKAGAEKLAEYEKIIRRELPKPFVFGKMFEEPFGFTFELAGIKDYRVEIDDDKGCIWSRIDKSKKKVVAQMEYDATDQKLVTALNKKMGTKLELQNFVDWMEGGETAEKFDRVVVKFMTKTIYIELLNLARVPAFLYFMLGLTKGTTKDLGMSVDKRAFMKAWAESKEIERLKKEPFFIIVNDQPGKFNVGYTQFEVLALALFKKFKAAKIIKTNKLPFRNIPLLVENSDFGIYGGTEMAETAFRKWCHKQPSMTYAKPAKAEKETTVNKKIVLRSGTGTSIPAANIAKATLVATWLKEKGAQNVRVKTYGGGVFPRVFAKVGKASWVIVISANILEYMPAGSKAFKITKNFATVTRAMGLVKKTVAKATAKDTAAIAKMKRKSPVKKPDSYTWYRYNGTRKVVVERSGWSLTLEKGVVFGAREATSKKGEYRLIVADKPTLVFTVPSTLAEKISNVITTVKQPK